MKQSALLLVVGCFLFVITGCATIVSGRIQSLPIVSTPDGATVTMGRLKQTTPCIIQLDRRMDVYQVKVEKDGYEPVFITLKKGINGWVFGNLIFGGIIGVIVDISTGSATSFKPSEVDIDLVRKDLGLEYQNKDIVIVKLRGEEI